MILKINESGNCVWMCLRRNNVRPAIVHIVRKKGGVSLASGTGLSFEKWTKIFMDKPQCCEYDLQTRVVWRTPRVFPNPNKRRSSFQPQHVGF